MRRLYPEFLGDPGALGLLVLRLVAGCALMMHGYPKIVVATSWMGPQTQLPGWLQAMSALVEFGGGCALILGLLTPLVCLGLIGNMFYALFLVHIAHHDPFVMPAGESGTSFELALLYLAMAFMFLLVGPGTHSLDFHMFGRGRVRESSRQQGRTPAWH